MSLVGLEAVFVWLWCQKHKGEKRWVLGLNGVRA